MVAQGHSIEARVYAEHPDHNFMPDSGTIRRAHFPATVGAFKFSGHGTRVDCGLQLGDEVGINYDPMIAKVITQGADRDDALARMGTLLDQIEVRLIWQMALREACGDSPAQLADSPCCFAHMSHYTDTVA